MDRSDQPDRPVRVRFAPSPTGPLHIGGVRTALFNWLFARHHGGTFILRIEDTDRSRYVPEALDLITNGLRWLGLDWDEGPEVGGEYGPYIQSERTALYRKWADWLVEHDLAYRCYCTSERLAQVREQQKANKQSLGYDRHCRNLSPDERDQRHAEAGGQHVVRFKMPREGTTVVHDLLRGDIEFDNAQLQDLVLLKSDGFPTYHLANVVDDHFMAISHIMRAEEWISTAPVHKNLYAAFGWEMPKIAHLPVILNPNGKGKLSKRSAGFTQDGVNVPILLHEFREGGYLPGALINFLTNIGWSFGEDREVFTVEDTITRFDLARVNPAGGAFPVDKLDWLNGVYIRDMDDMTLAQELKAVLEAAGYEVNTDVLLRAIPLLRDRIKRFRDVLEVGGFLFAEEFTPPTPETLIQKKMDVERTRAVLEAALALIEALPDFEPGTQEPALRQLAQDMELKAGQVLGTLREATTARKQTPPIFDTMALLGREKVIARIKLAIEELS
ncbi:MAG: glutamate--tRNA ligase [Anaerolineae bacterium]|nr:glutamate--tRNA ligase [Anaerolineae bacterium]